ncbi:MAG: hypothetical protein QOF71_864 [Candidatus Eremiobacteraeota bacterium]|jgi:hypothetical protein|nr:hypothetical protein [Candidatus Eremiobacteraeota bacterium]
MNRSDYLPIAAIGSLFFLPLTAQASPADLGPPTFQACAPAPQFVQIVNAVAPRQGGRETSSLRRLSSLSVSVEGSGGRYRIASGSNASVTIDAPVDVRACQAMRPTAVRLANGGSVPGNNAAAIAAVLAFRESNAWPYGAAHLDDPRTRISARMRNGHIMVSIADYKTLYSPNALGCGSEEYYRVDLQTFAVVPYDGCFEGAPARRVLPMLKDLPD